MFLENCRTALVSLVSNPTRSLLTMIGIAVGTTAVIAVVSIVAGLEALIQREMNQMGAAYIAVVPTDPTARPGDLGRPGKLTWEDGLALQRGISQIEHISPEITRRETVRWGDERYTTTVYGVSDSWAEVNSRFAETGRFFGHLDQARRRKVAVIGHRVVEEVFGGREPVGQDIRVGNVVVTVIGVVERRGRLFGIDQDDLVIVPFQTALGMFGESAGEEVRLAMLAKSSDDIPVIKPMLQEILRARHGLADGARDDFELIVQSELLDSVNSLIGGVTLVIVCVVGISLIVGGIGIMNTLLIAVSERTREVGLLKALGAQRSDILTQFLAEGVVLSSCGGMLGVIVGFGVGWGVAAVIPGWPDATLQWWAVALALGFSSFVGLFFSLVPAAKASALEPIDALRQR